MCGVGRCFLASGCGAGQLLEGIAWDPSAVVVDRTLLTGGLGSATATTALALLLGDPVPGSGLIDATDDEGDLGLGHDRKDNRRPRRSDIGGGYRTLVHKV